MNRIEHPRYKDFPRNKKGERYAPAPIFD